MQALVVTFDGAFSDRLNEYFDNYLQLDLHTEEGYYAGARRVLMASHDYKPVILIASGNQTMSMIVTAKLIEKKVRGIYVAEWVQNQNRFRMLRMP